ncbi:LLM class F420-dependent oxidoreductase [Jiangella asiatica]|uniref:LLM class F420-dependent oxidoreductase n=1 Tax=Jiangella asiatica TaxID=2530372 RepID=A0A4R5DEU3_9ACTN|nr:LLM class F420-dependent oxidoreductase [Jiangella asiatica]
MRFGLFVPQGWRLDLVDIAPGDQWEAMLRVAEHADRGGAFESIWVYDHFHTTPTPTDEATHEAWSLMAALGAATERIRLGQMCTCTAYRNPAYLAKVAATVDSISGGRLEMGIGAGWYEHEWRAYGYGFPSAGVRLGMLDEAVQIMRQAWTHGVSTLDGEHYQVDGAICRPLPLQDGGIPLWIAGGGEKVTLRIAAKNARGQDDDGLSAHTKYTNFGGIADIFRRKSEVLKRHCDDLGTDFDSITRTADYNVIVGRTQAEVDDQLARLDERNARFLTPKKAANSRKAFTDGPTVGTVDQVIESLLELKGLGMTYAICYFPFAAYDIGTVELFEKEVIPALS